MMALYTRTGDQGKTRLFGGVEANKYDKRVNTYGTVDELNSLVGVVVSELPTNCQKLAEELATIQQDLFDCGSDLATVNQKRPYKVVAERTVWLESLIDCHQEEAPKITKFIIPGGSKASAYSHLARTVTRRCERLVAELMVETQDVNPDVLTYLNRLSDYFFSVARALNAYQSVEDVVYLKSRDIFRNRPSKQPKEMEEK